MWPQSPIHTLQKLFTFAGQPKGQKGKTNFSPSFWASCDEIFWYLKILGQSKYGTETDF